MAGLAGKRQLAHLEPNQTSKPFDVFGGGPMGDGSAPCGGEALQLY